MKSLHWLKKMCVSARVCGGLFVFICFLLSLVLGFSVGFVCLFVCLFVCCLLLLC